MTSAILPNLIEISTDRSSQIAAIGYDADILFVQFRRGGLYTYKEVKPEEFQALMAADKPGEYFAKAIKGVKPYKRVDGKPAPGKADAKPEPGTALAKTKTDSKVLTMKAANPQVADDLATAAQEWAMKANAITIVDVAAHEHAQKMLIEIDTVKKRIVETWKPMKAAAFAAHRAVCDKESELLKPLLEADKLLRQRIGDYTYAQLKAAQVEDERRRLEAEQDARQNAMRETEEGALAAAEELLAMGDEEGANAVLAAPMPAPIRYSAPMPVQPAVANVEGVSGSITYAVTIHDLAQVPREYLVIDIAKTEAEIARRAKQAQGRLQVSGVSIRETFATRRTGRRA
jgi:KTSC domain